MISISGIKKRVNEQFDLMERECSFSVNDVSSELCGVDLRAAFIERLDSISDLIDEGNIAPDFDVITHRGEEVSDFGFVPKVLFFAFAGNPPHWAHILTALDAMVNYSFDKVVFVSGGNDPRKMTMIDVGHRYEMIRDALGLFGDLFAFSDIGEIPFIDEEISLISEYTLFKFLKQHEGQKMDVFYFAGSDHLHRSVSRDGEEVLDTVGILEKCVRERLLGFDLSVHSVSILFNARDSVEYEENRREVGTSIIDIYRLDPTVSSSSTSIRIFLNDDDSSGDKRSLVFLPYCNYVKIRANRWY